jgi:hypothetical protein
LAGILLSRSPAHAQLAHPRFGGAIPEKPTDETNVGSIIHGLLLGGGADVVPIDADNYRTKAAQEARDAAYQAGKIPMLAHKLEAVRASTEEISKACRIDFGNARCELTAIWESDGCPCRARLDAVFPGLIVDLKTSDNIAVASADRNIFTYGYHIQAAAYLDAFETLNPEEAGRVKFRLLFAETEPPYGVMQVELAGDFIDLGKRQWKRAKGLWAQCLATNVFPGYPESKTVHAPAWALSEAMDAAITASTGLPF